MINKREVWGDQRSTGAGMKYKTLAIKLKNFEWVPGKSKPNKPDKSNPDVR